MLQRLQESPTAYKIVSRQFVGSICESGEPPTEEMCETLIHLISEQLSNHSFDQLGQQLGHALSHVGVVSVIRTFASALVHAMGSTIAKLAMKIAGKVTIKFALKAGGKMMTKTVVTGLCASLAAGAAAKGMGTVAAIFANAALPLIIAGIIA